MLHRLILKVTKFQRPTPKRFITVVEKTMGAHHAPSPMLDRVKGNRGYDNFNSTEK